MSNGLNRTVQWRPRRSGNACCLWFTITRRIHLYEGVGLVGQPLIFTLEGRIMALEERHEITVTVRVKPEMVPGPMHDPKQVAQVAAMGVCSVLQSYDPQVVSTGVVPATR